MDSSGVRSFLGLVQFAVGSVRFSSTSLDTTAYSNLLFLCRLCVRNLPLKISEHEFSKVFSTAAGGKPAKIKRVLIMRNKERLDSTGQGRALGFGFVEFTNHSEALAALRATNNNPSLFGPDRRPIVEFSIENSLALKARQQRQQRSKQTQHQVEAEKGLAPKTNKEKRKERSLRRTEKRKLKREERKQSKKTDEAVKNESRVKIGSGEGAKKKEDGSQEKSRTRRTMSKQNLEGAKRKRNFPKPTKKLPLALSTTASIPKEKSPKSADTKPPRSQRKKVRNREREGKEESEFSAMVAKYKNKLFSADAGSAASSAKRTRWFE